MRYLGSSKKVNPLNPFNRRNSIGLVHYWECEKCKCIVWSGSKKHFHKCK